MPRRSLGLLRLTTASLVVAVFVAADVTPGYRVGQDTLSLLASSGAPLAWAVRVAFIAYGIAVVAHANALARRWQRPPVAVGLLRVGGVGAIAAGVAQKNLPGSPPTTASQLHVFAAILAGISLLAVMLSTGARILSGWRFVVTAVGGTIAVVAGLAFPLSWGSSFYGTLEITALTIPALWLATIAAAPSPRGHSGWRVSARLLVSTRTERPVS